MTTPITLAHDACVKFRLLASAEAFPGKPADIRALADRAAFGRAVLPPIFHGLLALADSIDLRDEALALPPGEGRMPLLLRCEAHEKTAAGHFREVSS